MFTLGLFDERTYVDADAADGVVAASPGWELAEETHRKSVVVLKNSGGALPLAPASTVYVEVFHKDPRQSAAKTAKARQEARESAVVELVETPEAADALYLILDPQSGDYFNATPGLLELTLCEDRMLKALNDEWYTETTLDRHQAGTELCRTPASARPEGGRVGERVAAVDPRRRRAARRRRGGGLLDVLRRPVRRDHRGHPADGGLVHHLAPPPRPSSRWTPTASASVAQRRAGLRQGARTCPTA